MGALIALSGWKQVIGTGLVYGSEVIPNPELAAVAKSLGLFFLGWGAGHRIWKNVTSDGRN